ncbi:MAG: prolyl oligopeptidase family serine peptidase [bacterium]|nr:prolyl oligopeptidase family serine peptidase [bacterium]
MKLRLLIRLTLVVLLIPLVYLVISALFYEQLARVQPHCGGRFQLHTPAAFSVAPFASGFDTAPYLMPDYHPVEISVVDPAITISAWDIPPSTARVPGETPVPTVIVVHGLGDCKQHPRSLLPAGMLHRAGYRVLMIDLREHGASTVEDGYWAGNTEEYRDVLSAWRWLVDDQAVPPEQIGIFAYSGGTAAALIAMGDEPRITTAWLDSVYVDLMAEIQDQVTRSGIPSVFLPGGLLIAQLHGDDLTAYAPLSAAAAVADRSLFITHSTDDQRLRVENAPLLAEAIQAAGGQAELWITEGSLHTNAMFDLAPAYEARLIAFFDAHLRDG